MGRPEPVLLDGRLSPGEWDDAAAVPIAGDVRLLVKRLGGHVYVAVTGGAPVPRPVDLFLQDASGTITQLHASMQIGERAHRDTLWDDRTPAWHWRNHVDWIASEAKVDERRPQNGPFATRLFPGEVAEFQIRRSRFRGGEWRVRMEAGVFPGTEAEPVVFPAGASRDPATWAVLQLD